MNAESAGARAPLPARSPGRSRHSGAASRRPADAVLALLVAGALTVVSLAVNPAWAQSGAADPLNADPLEMTVEELERYLEEQKAALERVRENRDITVEKAREVREALAEREARRAEAVAELEALCRERDEIEPGSYEDCAAQIGD